MSALLFLAPRCPYPPNKGDRIRSWHVLRYLAAHRPVHLIAFAEDRRVPQPLAQICRSVTLLPSRGTPATALVRSLATGVPASVAYFGDKAMTRAVQACLDHAPISTVYTFSGQMAQHVPALPAATRFILDFVDVDSAKYEELANHPFTLRRWVYRREARLLAAFEGAVAQRADYSLFVSGPEAALFRRRNTDVAAVGIVPNGIDAAHYAPSAFDKGTKKPVPKLVFTGQMDYAPNVDAVIWMAKHILPRIQAVRPEARFVIVGRCPHRDVRALARLPGVDVTGAVDDPRDWIGSADIVVAPMRIGRGIQNKVLEALSMGRPVVATPLAAEGIDIRPGQEYVRAAGVDAFARAVLDMLANPDRAARIGVRARQAMIDRYAWDRCLAPLKALIA